MSLKNVVKVMNFHALLRVDKSRRAAAKFGQMEQMVIDMLDLIQNNRNIALDMSALKFPESAPALHIYLGGDMGFCGNLNSLVKGRCQESIRQGVRAERILVGKKLRLYQEPSVVLEMSRDEFAENHQAILDLLARGITEKRYSEIRLIYNHYRNASEIDFVDKVILPLPKGLIGDKAYLDDFVWEGEPQRMMQELLILYLTYELEIAGYVSAAAENLTRQNVTTESLKRIDEREEEQRRVERKERKAKEFSKVLDNFTRLRNY